MDIDGDRPVKLKVLDENPEVRLSARDVESVSVTYRGRTWIVWPDKTCWKGTNAAEETAGCMYLGPVGTFRLVCIVRPPNLPRNHAKCREPTEISLLGELIERELLVTNIAKVLGRTNSSIASKVGAIMGLSFDNLRGDLHLGDLHVRELIARGVKHLPDSTTARTSRWW